MPEGHSDATKRACGVFSTEHRMFTVITPLRRHFRKMAKSDYNLPHVCPSVYVKVKVKQSRYRPGVAQSVPGS